MFNKLQNWMYKQGWRFWIGLDLACWVVLIAVGIWMFA